MRLALAAMAVLMTTVAFAGPPGGRAVPIDRLTEELQLDESQAAEVKQILEAQRERARELKDLDRSERFEAMRAIHEDTRAQLSGVLDEDQLARFDELVEQRKARRGKSRAGSGSGGGST